MVKTGNKMPLSIILLCFAAGVVLVLVETLVPGGVAGFLGGIFLFSGLVGVFVKYGPAYGSLLAAVMIAAACVGAYAWFHFLPKTRLGEGLQIGENAGGYVSYSPENAGLYGRTGQALTVLRPAGRVLIDGRKYDVVSSGDHISAGTAVRVCQVEGNRIVVEKLSEEKTV